MDRPFKTQDPVKPTGRPLRPGGKRALACFISPHGFGHASRMTAILERLMEFDPGLSFHLFTTVPRWFFDPPLAGRFSYHPTVTDIGFVQKTPFLEDLEATAGALDAFLPFDPALIDALAEKVSALQCRAVLCDIAPLGIAVAKAAGLCSVLIENFTWDFLYAGYPDFAEQVKGHMDYLSFLFDSADHRIQTEPVCRRKGASLTVPPIARKPRTDPPSVRKRLGLERDRPLVLVTLGGIPEKGSFYSRLHKAGAFHFVIPGASRAATSRDNVLFLPHKSDFYHPDLVFASDLVIGKAGYSTVAEVYSAGVPFGFIPRPDFAESPVLAEFIETRMAARRISMETFFKGDWILQIEDLLHTPNKGGQHRNGAPEAARFILGLLAS